MIDNEREKWDRYYSDSIPIDPPEVSALGGEFCAWVESYLPPGSRKVLEAGCGAGAQSLALANGSGFDVHLLDSSANALVTAEALFAHHGRLAHFHLEDLFDESAPEFDLVFNSGVIEHYEFPDQVRMVRAMARRSRGTVAVLAPNARCYWYWISRVRNTAMDNWPFGREVPVSSLRAVFEAAGLDVVEETYLGRAWTSLLLGNLPEIADPLKQTLQECHRSPLISDDEACYLYGILGTVRNTSVPVNQHTAGSERDEALAMTAEALAIRVGSEQERTQLRDRVDVLAEQCYRREADNHRLDEERRMLLREQETLLERTRSIEEQRQSLSEQHGTVLEEQRTLRERHEALREQHLGLREERQALIEQHNALREQHGSLHKEQRALREQLHALEAQYGTIQQDCATLREENRTLLEQVGALREQHGTLLEQHHHLQGRHEASQEQSRTLHEQLQWATCEVARLGRQTADLSGNLDASRREVAKLREGVGHYDAAFERTLGEYRSQRAWWVMLAVRRAYDLWMRQGWRGKLRAIPTLLRGPFAAHEDTELQFPAVKHYVPAPFALIESSSMDGLPSLLAPPQRKFDVVILAIIDFDFRFQRPQQMATQFARDGHRVFWISPTRFLPPASPHPYQMVPLRENVWEIHPRGQQPDIYMGELKPEAQNYFEDSLRHLYRDLAISENIALVQLPFWRRPALTMRRENQSVVVYDCMDEWDSFQNMGPFNSSEERLLAAECDVLVVTARKLEEKFTAQGLAPVLARNGVDYEFFASSEKLPLLPDVRRPIVGYFGAIADWIDLELVHEVARHRPQYTFVLIGQVFGRDTSALAALPNVLLLGNQKHERIPSYLNDFDVCAIPFLLNDVTAATDPVKLYEYLSLGKPVVATDMAELRPYAELVYIARDVDEFCRNIDSALAEPDDDLKNQRIDFAKRNTWKARARAIEPKLREQYPLISIVIVTHNSLRFLRPCMQSILRNGSYPHCEIIVVDNGSTDGTIEVLGEYAREHANVRCERLPTNRGFAAANNAGVELSRGEYIALLNVDTIVTPGWLGRLLAQLRRDPSIGLICPVTNFAGNEARIAVPYVDERSMEHFASVVAMRNRGVSIELRMAPLFCAMISRDLFQELGGLDERYGIGMFEDDDLAEAVHKRGLLVVAAEDCFVHHFGQGAFAKLDPNDYNALFDRNLKEFESKWETHWHPHQMRPGVKPPMDDVRFEPEGFGTYS